MGDDQELPPFVMGLPATYRRQIARQCGGDWRRVTLDADGGVTVHNQPQRSLDQRPSERVPDDPDPRPRKELIPTLPPLPTPLWAKGPQPKKKPAVGPETTLRRVELPTAGPPKKYAKKAVPKPAPVEAVQEDVVAPSAPPPVRAAPPRLPDLFTPPAPAPAPMPEPQPRAARPRSKRRTGSPRTAKEMLGQILDLGCTYRRIAEQDVAVVKYEGEQIANVPTNDNLDRTTVSDTYRRVQQLVQIRKVLSE